MIHYKYLCLLVCVCMLLQLTCYAQLREQFMMQANEGTPIGTPTTNAGINSIGWISTWQLAQGAANFSITDLEVEGLPSNGGALKLIGEKKEKFSGKGVVVRQISESYTGDVYGAFRFNSGKLHEDSIIGLLIGVPAKEPLTPKNAFFAICPKRWGSPLGMIAAGNKVSKVKVGSACLPFDTNLVLWKLEKLPEIGKRKTIGLKMWILNSAQATYFAKENFSETKLTAAESGALENEILQHTSMTIRNSKRTIARGMVVALYGFSTSQLHFDEIAISNDGFILAP